ncbi:DUF5701 family protein [Yimella sp. cx-51]|uniref:DUF5701 family protein n=1 Tax=Yimella sp. cx-51 TaxID=2770551 RepID=UPI00165E20C4|nr:DUF5701 family protein [Yimella sp. cx-51]MBC9955500.1 hypothetical protein [Yimella sp. cx-51]QTH37914.1 hypothetical protein J5M86_13905 [Yimella sp. cx-51]
MQDVEHLVELGLPDMAGVTAERFRELAPSGPGVLVVSATFIAPSRLAPLLLHGGKPGFVVEDLTDLEDFVPLSSVEVPEAPMYRITGLDRGDDLRNWSPDESLPELISRGRSPLTISEGISWLLADPAVLQPNHCFMCIGSRKQKGKKLDARTPALWISGGTGRDGRERKGAVKVGWCWAGNQHTWLGFASTTGRRSAH